jgi:hypothetical protein
MRTQKVLLAATLSVLWLSACNGNRNTPTESTGSNTFGMDATLFDAAGKSTIIDAKLVLDRSVISEYVGAAVPSVEFVDPSPNTIAEGNHFLDFMLASQTTNAPLTTYTVPAFTFTVYDCDGVDIEDIPMPAQTATLTVGQSISYRLNTPAASGDTCTANQSGASSAGKRRQPRGPAAGRGGLAVGPGK